MGAWTKNKIDASKTNVWHQDAIEVYKNNSQMKAWGIVRSNHSEIYLNRKTFIDFLKNAGVYRSKEQNQQRSRELRHLQTYPCVCLICQNDFYGLAPNSAVCQVCVPGKHGSSGRQERMVHYNQHRKWLEYEKKFGIDKEILRSLLVDEQKYLCGLCNQFMIQPHLDHNHDTGNARGFLCSRCNLLLGQVERLLKYKPDWVSNMFEWIATKG